MKPVLHRKTKVAGHPAAPRARGCGAAVADSIRQTTLVYARLFGHGLKAMLLKNYFLLGKLLIVLARKTLDTVVQSVAIARCALRDNAQRTGVEAIKLTLSYGAITMYVTPEQVTANSKASVETLLAIANSNFAAIEKLAALNFNATKAAFEDSMNHAKALLNAKDVQELVNLNVAAAQPSLEKAIAYSRSVYELVDPAAGRSSPSSAKPRRASTTRPSSACSTSREERAGRLGRRSRRGEVRARRRQLGLRQLHQGRQAGHRDRRGEHRRRDRRGHEGRQEESRLSLQQVLLSLLKAPGPPGLFVFWRRDSARRNLERRAGTAPRRCFSVSMRRGDLVRLAAHAELDVPPRAVLAHVRQAEDLEPRNRVSTSSISGVSVLSADP